MKSYEELMHEEMRDRVKELCNKSGGRKKLAEQMGISYDFIADICDGVYFPPVSVFELRFGPLTVKKPVEVTAVDSDDETDLLKLDIPVTIRCPEFDKLAELMSKVGYDVRIVLDR